MTRSETTVTEKRAPVTMTKEEKKIRPSKKVPKVPAKNAFKAGKGVSKSKKCPAPATTKRTKNENSKSKNVQMHGEYKRLDTLEYAYAGLIEETPK